jgi:hypothetical protein
MSQKPKSNSKNGPQNSDGLAASKAAADDTEYKVGPGRPPKEHQWPPGQSGNPKGRKPKPRSILLDFKPLFDRALNKKVPITNGERKSALTKFEIGMEQLANQHAKGDRHARREVFAIAEKLGIDLQAGQEKTLENPLASDHQAILDAFVDRQYDKVVQREAEMASPGLLDDDVDGQNRS